MLCMECGSEMRLTSEDISFDVRGESFNISGIEHYVCSQCGEEELGIEEASELQKCANARYAEKHGMLSPSEIREIRKRYKLTQQQFESMIDAGKTSMSRWEGGSVLPSGTTNTLIRVIGDNPDVVAQLEERAEIPINGSVCGKFRFKCQAACELSERRMNSIEPSDYTLTMEQA